MRLRLRVGSGARIGEVLNLTAEGGVLGRDPAHRALQLPDASVSMRHVQIHGDGKQFFVQDLGSTNGTFLDGVALLRNQPVPLLQRGKLKLGDVLLEYHAEGTAPGAQPPQPPPVQYGVLPPLAVPDTYIGPPPVAPAPARYRPVVGEIDTTGKSAGQTPIRSDATPIRLDAAPIRLDPAAPAIIDRLLSENDALHKRVRDLEQQLAARPAPTAASAASAGGSAPGDLLFQLRESEGYLAGIGTSLAAADDALKRSDAAGAREHFRRAAAQKAELHALLLQCLSVLTAG